MQHTHDAPSDPRLDEVIEADARRRLERLANANTFIAQWRERHLGPAAELVEAEPWIADHAAGVDHLTSLLEKGAELESAGKVAASTYWAKEVQPLWRKVFSDDVRGQIDDVHSRYALPRTGFEGEFMAQLVDWDFGDLDYSVRYGKYGAKQFRQDPPAPPRDDSAVVRQPLKPPINRCAGAPFTFGALTRPHSGPAINDTSAGASLADGSGFASARTFAPIAMAGGASTALSIGTSFDYPSGYSTLRVSATLDVSWAGRSITILGGATASINIVVRAILLKSRMFQTTRLLSSIPAPLLFFSETSGAFFNQHIESGDIDVAGEAGTVLVAAGVEVYTAAVGIVGSSAARMDANFVVRNLCISLV
jgi:hypothetical protein